MLSFLRGACCLSWKSNSITLTLATTKIAEKKEPFYLHYYLLLIGFFSFMGSCENNRGFRTPCSDLYFQYYYSDLVSQIPIEFVVLNNLSLIWLWNICTIEYFF